MITTNIDAVLSKIKRKQQLHMQVDEAKVFTTRANQLEEMNNSISLQFKQYEWLQKQGIVDKVQIDAAKDCLGILCTMVLEFNKNPNAIRDFRFDDLKRSIYTINRTIKTHIDQSWYVHYNAKMPTLNQSILNTFKNIRSVRSVVSNIELGIAKLVAYQVRVPESPMEYQAFLQTIDDIQKEWAKLDSDVPAEVIEFLTKAASIGGVPLEMLTDSIRKWLIEHKLTNEFLVKTRGA